MKHLFFLCLIFIRAEAGSAQLNTKLSSAMVTFNKDEQLRFATTALLVVDGATGETVFDQKGATGMAPASTLKIITAATAFDLLGKDYRYETRFGIVQTAKGKSLYIQASGDPTLGSWRWEKTKERLILEKLKNTIAGKGINEFESIIINTKNWMEDDGIPSAWTWGDIGQYYGATSYGLNWRENQFDLSLKTGSKTGDKVTIVKTEPELYDYKIISEAKTAGRESGDESALFYPSGEAPYGVLKGTLPAGHNHYIVSGSMYQPSQQFAKTIISELKGIAAVKNNSIEITDHEHDQVEWLYTHQSPALSEIIYWFLRKSINLYGEALLRTVALKVKGEANSQKGIEAIQRHWENKGMNVGELRLYDGSGLSPENRITPHAEVEVLKYARKQPWFDEFYEALPLYNDMKMKSGTISGVKGYAGYQKSRFGKEYIFSMLINNYHGSQYNLIRKMYKVLDCLK